MKKIKRLFSVVPIDSLVYRMACGAAAVIPDITYQIDKKSMHRGKTKYSITDGGVSVHTSFLFARVHMLGLLGKKGPVIGDCITNPEYRGKSIYPFVVSSIANEQLRSGKPEVFIIVSPDNASSIRGIEKAGFSFFAHVKAKRFLAFYFNVRISRERA